MPHLCPFQNYDQSMSQLSSGSEGCSSKMYADEVNDEDKARDVACKCCPSSYFIILNLAFFGQVQEVTFESQLALHRLARPLPAPPEII